MKSHWSASLHYTETKNIYNTSHEKKIKVFNVGLTCISIGSHALVSSGTWEDWTLESAFDTSQSRIAWGFSLSTPSLCRKNLSHLVELRVQLKIETKYRGISSFYDRATHPPSKIAP